MKVTCDCLVTLNKSTGKLEKLVIDIPDDRVEEMRGISRAGWEAGRRFKLGLASCENTGISTNDPLASLGERTAAAIVVRDFGAPTFEQEYCGNWETAR